MSKQLLVEYRPFEVKASTVKESMERHGGRLIVSGVLQRANAKNQNGRVYPKEVLIREAKKYQEEFIDQNRAMGELDHSDSSVVELKNTSHHITKMWWSDDDLMGEVEILPTPYGNILKNLFEANITLGISSRGVGSVREVYTEDKGATMEVQSDFELISFDFVSNPSTQGAFLSPVNEGRIINTSHSSNIDKLISNIICDLSGVCDCEKK